VAQAETHRKRLPQLLSGGRLAVVAGSGTALVIATLVGSALTFAHQAACWSGAWESVDVFRAGCASDIRPVYLDDGLVHGQIPYLDHAIHYPVLVGAVAQAVAWVVHSIASPEVRGREFYDLTTAGLVLCAVGGVLATAYLAGRSRRWTALLVALSPGLILAAFVSWDLMAMALTAAAMVAWARRRGVLAGVLFGLAAATMFYPLILLAALFPLCLRAGRRRAFLVTSAAAVATWLALNLPIMILAFHGWSSFYRSNWPGFGDYGSIWYFTGEVAGNLNPVTTTGLSLALTLVAFALIAWLVLAAPRRPRVPQVLFLALAAYLMLAEAWNPWYVIWLVPLAVLARPRTWAYLLWQAAEAAFIFAYWPDQITEHYPSEPGGISSWIFLTAQQARFLTLAMVCALVVRDILRPGADLVRRDGEDDPAGGVLDGAADAVTIRLGARPQLIRGTPTRV
jgi:uncharacterized membrane protein